MLRKNPRAGQRGVSPPPPVRPPAPPPPAPPPRTRAPKAPPAPTDGPADGRGRAVVLVGLGLFTLALAPYLRTLDYPFVNYDDPDYVTENPHVTGGLTPGNVWWALTGVRAANWHPLTWLSHQLDWALFGPWAGGHHLTSALLHAATAVLLFLALARLTGRFWPPAVVAAVWAVHPLRVESVAWVSERKDVLCGLFFALALLAYERYARAPSRGRYALVAAALALGLMAKSMLVTLPCVLLLLDYWPLNRLTSRAAVRRAVAEKIPLFGLVVVSVAATLVAQTVALTSTEEFPLPVRVGNAVASYGVYLVQAAYPVDLVVFYPHPGDAIPAGRVAASAAVLLAVTAAAVALRRRAPYLPVGWFWYLGMLVPVIGLVQVGSQAHADRYTYLPHVGLLVAVVWGLADLIPAGGARAAGAAAVAVVATLLVLTWNQVAYWRDSEALFTHDLECVPESYLARMQLANAAYESGRKGDALAHNRRAYELNDKNSEVRRGLAILYNDFGVEATSAGRPDEAVAHFRLALEMHPDHDALRQNLATAYATQAAAAARAGRTGDALDLIRRALEVAPRQEQIRASGHAIGFGAGVAAMDGGRFADAAAHFRTALGFDGSHAPTRVNLARCLVELGRAAEEEGRRGEAVEHYRGAVEVAPGNAEARAGLERVGGGNP